MNQLRYNSEFAIVHLPPSKDVPVDYTKIAEDEYDNRIVNYRILKQRAQPNSEFKAEEFKQGAMVEMAQSGEVAKFRSSMQRSINSSASQRSQKDKGKLSSRGDSLADKSSKSKPVSRGKSFESSKSRDKSEEPPVEDERAKIRAAKAKRAQEMEEERQIIVRMKLTDERTQQRATKITDILKERADKKDTPSFRSDFFKSFAGQEYLSINPPEPPSEEVITRMKQRIERNKQARDRGEIDADGQSIKGSNINEASIERSNDLVMVGDNMEDKDNPIVALEPDDNLK